MRIISAYKIDEAESLSFVSIPPSHVEAMVHLDWRVAMEEEIHALQERHTWDLTTISYGKDVVGCCWVFAIKYLLDGSIERLKAHLVPKGYTQTPSVDFF